MARITLRDYNNEINDLIDHGQIEEAISHCRHILKQFPKYVDTYRLLGKAYLEQQRYGDAADILQRVLSSIPDDFISQIGMSIIREDEMNLDAAIYHMELAFESQPSNHAIQDELRRLFAKRDGMEPPRIRLTRGALARMYAHGRLYEQAISEIQAALSEDPNRYDLQTLLADMLNQIDKKVEAAETCTRILEKLPFNLAANRLLATILIESGREEEAQRYKKRWIALNPYAASITDPTMNLDQVPDDAVTIEHESWEPTYGDALGDEQPVWATPLDDETEGEATPDEMPDWLTVSGQEPSEFSPAEPSPLLDSSEAGWMTEDASSSESPFGSLEEEDTEDDWMAEFTGAPDAQTPISEEGESDEDWMAEFGELEAAPSPTGEESPEPEITPESLAEGSETDDDWLAALSEEDHVKEPRAETELPDFLQEAGWVEGSQEGEEQPGAVAEQPDELIAEGEIPDWVQEMAPSETSETEPEPAEDLGALADVKAEADPEWLQEMQEKPQEPGPDWLGELDEKAEKETPETPIRSREVDPAGYLAGDFGEDDTDDWLASLGAAPAEEGTPDETGEEAPENLPEMPADQPALPEEDDLTVPSLEVEPSGFLAGDYGEDDTDDWLASLAAKQVESGSEIESEDEDLLQQPEPDTTEETPLGALEEAPEIEDEGFAWLESLAAKHGAAEEELVTTQAERDSFDDDYTPSFLEPEETEISAIDEEETPETGEPESIPESPVPVEAVKPIEEDDSMDWLTSISEETEDAPVEDDVETPISAPAVEAEDDFSAIFGEDLEESEPKDGEETLDWLQDLSAEPEAGPETLESDDLSAIFGEAAEPTEEPVLEQEDDNALDWLDKVDTDAAPEAEEVEKAEQDLPTTPIGDVPEFEDLSALFGSDKETPADADDQEALDWLQELGGEPIGEAEAEDLSRIFTEPGETETPLPEEVLTPEAVIPQDDEASSLDWLESVGEDAADADAAETIPDAPPLEEPADQIKVEETDDQGLAWLESLAEKQGAAEEELITTPEERTSFDDEHTPEWLREIEEDDEPAAAPATTEELDDLDALLDEVEEIAEAQSAAPAADIFEEDDDFSMDWLDSISQEAAAEAMADEEPTAEQEEAAGELLGLFGEEGPPPPTPEPISDVDVSAEETLRFEEDVEEEAIPPEEDTAPEWRKIIEEEKAPTLPPTPEPVLEEEEESETPADILEEPELVEEAAAPVVEDKPAQDVLEEEDDFSMDWLDSISQEAAVEAGAIAEGESTGPIPVDKEEETPEWLAEIEEEDDEAAIVEGLESLDEIFGAGEETASEPQEIPPSGTMVPEWLQDIADQKPAAEPAPEPEWLPGIEEPSPEEEVQPVQAEDWQPEVQASAPPEETPPAAEEPTIEPEGAAPSPPEPSEAITSARRSVQSGDLEGAIKQFGALIKKGKELDSVIEEIKDALRRHPVNVEFWQALGDAYMKENNLQEALDAYSKAENLLR